MNIFLDVDGVILTKDGKPAKHLKEFLEHITQHHTVYFLTTHCKGDAEYTRNYLSRFLDPEIIQFLKSVKATNFQTLKTEAIDFNSDFIWLDDYLFDSEIEELERHNKRNSWIKVDLKNKPNQLLELIKQP